MFQCKFCGEIVFETNHVSHKTIHLVWAKLTKNISCFWHMPSSNLNLIHQIESRFPKCGPDLDCYHCCLNYVWLYLNYCRIILLCLYFEGHKFSSILLCCRQNNFFLFLIHFLCAYSFFNNGTTSFEKDVRNQSYKQNLVLKRR